MDIANVEAAEAWDGHEGAHWAEHADRYERSSVRHRPHLINASIIGSGDRVLDVGCGAGLSTIDASQLASDGSALGLDLSSQMLARARERAAAEGVGNVTFEQGDAQVHPLEPGAADVAISLYGAMFFGDPVAAFTNIAGGLRPGGRLALLAWRDLAQNEWLMTVRGALALGRDLPTPPPDAPTPFSLADPDRVQARLTAAGFGDIELTPVDEPADLGADADDAFAWFSTVGIVEGLLGGIDEAGRAQGMDNLRAAFKEAETSDGVLLGTAAWLITATRT
jgi:SAM-dependent methyltransferase